MEEYKNGNGTYNGAEMLSDLSGISADEITAMFERMKQLRAEGKTKEEATAIVKREFPAKSNAHARPKGVPQTIYPYER